MEVEGRILPVLEGVLCVLCDLRGIDVNACPVTANMAYCDLEACLDLPELIPYVHVSRASQFAIQIMSHGSSCDDPHA